MQRTAPRVATRGGIGRISSVMARLRRTPPTVPSPACGGRTVGGDNNHRAFHVAPSPTSPAGGEGADRVCGPFRSLQLDLAVEALDQRSPLRIELVPIDGADLGEIVLGFRDSQRDRTLELHFRVRR